MWFPKLFDEVGLFLCNYFRCKHTKNKNNEKVTLYCNHRHGSVRCNRSSPFTSYLHIIYNNSNITHISAHNNRTQPFAYAKSKYFTRNVFQWCNTCYLCTRKQEKSLQSRCRKIFWKKLSKNLDDKTKRYYLCTTFAFRMRDAKNKRDHWNNKETK